MTNHHKGHARRHLYYLNTSPKFDLVHLLEGRHELGRSRFSDLVTISPSGLVVLQDGLVLMEGAVQGWCIRTATEFFRNPRPWSRHSHQISVIRLAESLSYTSSAPCYHSWGLVDKERKGTRQRPAPRCKPCGFSGNSQSGYRSACILPVSMISKPASKNNCNL